MTGNLTKHLYVRCGISRQRGNFILFVVDELSFLYSLIKTLLKFLNCHFLLLDTLNLDTHIGQCFFQITFQVIALVLKFRLMIFPRNCLFNVVSYLSFLPLVLGQHIEVLQFHLFVIVAQIACVLFCFFVLP